jgi:RHS repeat-associated protein
MSIQDLVSTVTNPSLEGPNGNVYDANGNYQGFYSNGQYIYVNTYDVENRLVGTLGGPAWTYDPWGKRIAKNAQDLQNCEVYFYGITGKKLATFRCVQSTDDSGNTIYSVQPNGYAAYNVYFGGRMLQSNGTWVVTDRLGSVRATATSTSISFVTNEAMAYFPYGVERTSTPDGREKFAGYIRDSAGQDYADQRYYSAAMGRFLTPDPVSTGTAATSYRPNLGAVNLKFPLSWNRYVYAMDDPISLTDPSGLCYQDEDGNYYDDDDPGSCFGGGGVIDVMTPSVTVSADYVPVGPLDSGNFDPTLAQMIGSNLQGFSSFLGVFSGGSLGGGLIMDGLAATLTSPGLTSLAQSLATAVPAIGRNDDLRSLADNPVYNTLQGWLQGQNWSMDLNQQWANSIIQSGQSISLQPLLTSANTFNGGPYNNGYTVFGVELGWFFNAGYTVSGSYLVPPVH